MEIADFEQSLERASMLFGPLLHVTGYAGASQENRGIIALHLMDAASLPASLVARVRDAGLAGVFIGDGRVADLDDMAVLSDLSEYDNVSGVYDRNRRYIVVGTRGNTPIEGRDFLHEFGHAIGDLLEFNDSIQVHERHANLDFWLRLHRSFRGPSPGSELGKRELFAEAVRDVLLDVERAAILYGSDFVRWLREELGT